MRQISHIDLKKLSRNKQIIFACFCAEQVIHLVDEKHRESCKKAIETAYSFLEGRASVEDCAAAAAGCAIAPAGCAIAPAGCAIVPADYAAYTVANAAYYATRATNSTKSSSIKAQWDFYDQLLNEDKYFEEILLKS